MKRTPLRRQSQKRAKENSEYLKLRHKFLTTHPLCQICRDNRAGQVHHINGRNGVRLLITDDWLAICQSCHDRIHREPAWARANGYLK